MHRPDVSRSYRRREFLGLLGSSLLTTTVAGCGTIFYPERIGQSHGPLDWKVVALDTVGLLLFLVPGVVAFVVDFHNGTIYLPPEQVLLHDAPVLSRKVSIPKDELSLGKIAASVNEETGLSLALNPGTYVTRELPTLADYPATAKQVAIDLERGVVRCQSPDARQ